MLRARSDGIDSRRLRPSVPSRVVSWRHASAHRITRLHVMLLSALVCMLSCNIIEREITARSVRARYCNFRQLKCICTRLLSCNIIDLILG